MTLCHPALQLGLKLTEPKLACCLFVKVCVVMMVSCVVIMVSCVVMMMSLCSVIGNWLGRETTYLTNVRT